MTNSPSSKPATAAAAGRFPLADGAPAVDRLGFGAMRITGDGVWGWPADRDNALAVLRRALELGVDLIDTADSYGPETSELLIAEALHPYAEGVVIATKAGLTRPGPGDWRPDCRPERLKACCEDSLRRLRVDAIDIYQLHTVDPDVPYAESVGALAELREAGKVRHVGLSNVSVEQVAQAREIVPIVSVQNRYSMFDRHNEPVLQYCEREGLGFIPWFPLGAGDLVTAQAESVLAQVAADHDATVAQVALAWLLRHSPAMLPIPGTKSLAHLEENVAAAALELTHDAYERLDALATSGA